MSFDRGSEQVLRTQSSMLKMSVREIINTNANLDITFEVEDFRKNKYGS